MANQQTQQWLESLGFSVQPEPDWVADGEVPDLYATGPTTLWVEVKALESKYELGDALADLSDRCEKIRNPGNGLLHSLVYDYDSKAGKVAIAFAAKAAATPIRTNVPIIMIPGDPAYGTNVCIEYVSEGGDLVCQVGPASVSGAYQCYPSLEPKDWTNAATLTMSNGNTDRAPLYKLLNCRVPFKLALRLFPADSPLSAGSGSGGVHRNTAQKRIREAVNKANSQIRNGQRFAPGPGLVTIYHDGMDALGIEMFLAALFGDITMLLGGNPPRLRETVFGKNAALTTGQHRAISAVRYHPHKNDPITVVNPYAAEPIEWQTFTEAAWILDGEKFVLHGR